MGFDLSTNQAEAQTERIDSADEQESRTFSADDDVPAAEFGDHIGSRYVEFMQAVKRVGNLEQQAVTTQIIAREKRRAAGFKRREVWIRDAAFMKELQRLQARGKLKGFETLMSLAEDCQTIHDELGPLEEEAIEAEYRLEGDFWKLQQAQESMFREFTKELHSAERYLSEPPSEASSPFQSDAGSENSQIVEWNDSNQRVVEIHPSKDTKNEIILELREGVEGDQHEIPHRGQIQSNRPNNSRDSHPSIPIPSGFDWQSDSGVGDIDQPIQGFPTITQAPVPHVASIERHPELSTVFQTKRERIKKWLLNTALLSRMEASILEAQLNAEDEAAPSNWSQLVLAYLEVEATTTQNFVNITTQDQGNSGGTTPQSSSYKYPKNLSDGSTELDSVENKSADKTPTEESRPSGSADIPFPAQQTDDIKTWPAVPPETVDFKSWRRSFNKPTREHMPP